MRHYRPKLYRSIPKAWQRIADDYERRPDEMK
jgi:hypothetical protein